LDAWKKYEPLYEWSKYRYLLNLPGHYPWSNRYKFLFLLQSLVVNVEVETRNIDPGFIDSPYVSLIDSIIENNVHYTSIPYIYYRTSKNQTDQDLIAKIEVLNEKEFERFIHSLRELHLRISQQPEYFQKIAENGHKLVLLLNMDRIYQYLYNAVCLTAELQSETEKTCLSAPPGFGSKKKTSDSLGSMHSFSRGFSS